MLRKLNPFDFPKAVDLLNFWKLPSEDLANPHVQLFGLNDEAGLKGIGGLETYGEHALIRSVAVNEDFKGQGLGKLICDELEQIAAKSGVKSLYLLTTTAASFFEHRGYSVISREQFPDVLKSTGQFSNLCPVSAICMMKTI